jgi:hypothetical protein
MGELLLLAGSEHSPIAELAAHIGGHGEWQPVILSAPPSPQDADCGKTQFLSAHAGERLRAIVVFLDRHRNAREQRLLDLVAAIAAEMRPRCIIVVSTFRVHFGKQAAVQREADVRKRLGQARARLIVFRPGHILDLRGRALLRTLAFCWPLVPVRFRSCWLESEELFAAIERELKEPFSRKARTYTLLGPNRSWKGLLRDHMEGRLGQRLLTVLTILLGLLLLGQFLGLLFDLATKFASPLRSWNFDTLFPESTEELLALYNPYSYRYIKIVGYNNGVTHFGQRYPRKTLVSTIHCNRVARVNGRLAKFDGGVTIRQATDVLGRAGKELPVVPNYSYVSLGTGFFIPIHGSANDVTMLGDIIEKVVLYDPVQDRIIATARNKVAFCDSIYNLERDLLLLRLYVRIKDKARYFLRQESLTNPTASDLLTALQDPHPSNVEIRKSTADNPVTQVFRYYTHPSSNENGELEFPRDTVGRVWDKLETNRVSAGLFHGLMRRFGYHVELFLPPDEFALFWATHRGLPIRKLQLRYLKRDAFPHSPCREHDCISADLFLLRKHKAAFESYVKATFRAVQFNPGKHSL